MEELSGFGPRLKANIILQCNFVKEQTTVLCIYYIIITLGISKHVPQNIFVVLQFCISDADNVRRGD